MQSYKICLEIPRLADTQRGRRVRTLKKETDSDAKSMNASTITDEISSLISDLKSVSQNL